VNDETVDDLLRRSQFVIEVTVRDRGRSTVADLPSDDHTVVVVVDRVLHAPAALSRSQGAEVTVQLLPGSAVPDPGESLVLFTTAVAFGQGIAVAEVGRSRAEAVGPTVLTAGAPAVVRGARAGRSHPVLAAAERLRDEALRDHAAAADAVVVGRVVSVQKVGPPPTTEHDPDLWRATIEVHHTEKGEVGDHVDVLFANSVDVRSVAIPKPQPGQDGVFVLHAGSEQDREYAPFVLQDAHDVLPADQIDRMRAEPN